MTSDVQNSAELDALREAVRDLIAGSGGPAAARRRLDAGPGFDERAWQMLGQEIGLAGLGIAEESGGAGGGLAELTVVAEEVGRALLPVPFFSSTVLAGQVLSRCPGDVAGVADTVGQLAGGTVVGFAGTDGDGCWRSDRLAVSATDAGGNPRLRGTVPFVLDGDSAEYLVVAAKTPDGCDLFLVSGDADGVRRRALKTLDPSRSQAELSFDDAPATPLTSGGAGGQIVDAALDVALVVLAAEQVGGAAACLDMAVDYAKIRHQFSRPIGSFQAIKHKLADLLLLVEMGRSALDRALGVQDSAALAEAGAIAKIWCSEAFTTVATENVHINGGTGFTWEHDAHLFLRRAKSDEVLLGGPAMHRERLAQLLSW